MISIDHLEPFPGKQKLTASSRSGRFIFGKRVT